MGFYTIDSGLCKLRNPELHLLIIKKEKLYRLMFSTYEEHCRERSGFAKSQAYRLIDAAKVNQNLSTIVDKPALESQIRPLTRLEPEKQKEVWKKAVETSPEGKDENVFSIHSAIR
jgi:hypothetical protein